MANATPNSPAASARFAAAGTLLLALAFGSHASAQSLDAAAKASNELGMRVQLLRSQYVMVAEFRSQNDAVTKIADAQLRYRISDWDSASILLAQVVDEPRYAASAGLRDAKFMLADSLFHLRNFDLAKKHFRDLVATKDANYALKSARRLLEMAYIDGNYSDLDSMFSEFTNGDMGNLAQMSATCAERPSTARATTRLRWPPSQVSKAPESSSFAPPTSLPSHAPVSDNSKRAVRPSRQSSCSSAKEERRGTRTAQSRPSWSRPHLLRTEAVWCRHRSLWRSRSQLAPIQGLPLRAGLVLRAEGRSRDAVLALQRLQIYATNDPELRYYLPEAGLLIGDFQLRESRYQEATASFARVIRSERPDVAGVEQILSSQSDPAAFLKLLVNEVDGRLELPAFAQPFFVQDKHLKRALDISNDLAQASANVADSELALAELDTGINSRSRVNIFPEMRDGGPAESNSRWTPSSC